MFDVKQSQQYACLHGAEIGDRLVNDYGDTRLTRLSTLRSGYDIVSPDRIALRSCMYSSSWSNHLS